MYTNKYKFNKSVDSGFIKKITNNILCYNTKLLTSTVM